MSQRLNPKTLFLTLLCTAPICAQGETPPGSAPALQQPPGLALIQAKKMQAHADYLASKELGGRLTGSAGQEAAAKFIAAHFAKLGLEPMGDADEGGKRGFFQYYPIKRQSLVVKESALSLGAGEQAVSHQRGFAVLPGSRAVEEVAVTGKIVFAGRIKGRRFIRAGERESFEGCIPVLDVVALGGGRKMGIEQQMGFSFTTLQAVKAATSQLQRQGASCVLLALADGDAALSNMLTYMSLAPGQDMVSMGRGSQMQFMMRMVQSRVPVMFCGPQITKALAPVLGKEAAAMPAKLKLKFASDEQGKASNVVAVLRGSDPKLSAEAIVYSAHMDHVGQRLDGEVFNGADDNASGTAGLMAIAEAFAKGGKPPRRSVIFLSVSGEELGLWGSAWYAKHPTWAKDRIVANINTDMIGRSGPESGAKEITVTPSFKHRKFSTIVRDSGRIAAAMGLRFRRGDKYYTRSDHYNFAKIGIPVVFFCNGEHEDYHQVSDTPDKLDAQKMQTIGRLAYWTGYLVAQADSRPKTLGRASAWVPQGDK